jgi:hypothetical protein
VLRFNGAELVLQLLLGSVATVISVFPPVPPVLALVATVLAPIAQILSPVPTIFAPVEPVFDAVAFATIVFAVANILPAIQPVFAPVTTVLAPIANVFSAVTVVFSAVNAILDAICHAAFPLQTRLRGLCGSGPCSASPQQHGERGHPDNTPPTFSHDVSSPGSVLLELTCTESNTTATPKLRPAENGLAGQAGWRGREFLQPEGADCTISSGRGPSRLHASARFCLLVSKGTGLGEIPRCRSSRSAGGPAECQG